MVKGAPKRMRMIVRRGAVGRKVRNRESRDGCLLLGRIVSVLQLGKKGEGKREREREAKRKMQAESIEENWVKGRGRGTMIFLAHEVLSLGFDGPGFLRFPLLGSFRGLEPVNGRQRMR